MHTFSLSTWGNVSGDSPVRCTVSGSDLACLVVGDGAATCELNFDANGLRLLVQQSTTAMAEMDALFEQEESARIA